MMNILETQSGKALAGIFTAAALAFTAPSDALAKDMLPSESRQLQAEEEGLGGNILQDYWAYFEYATKAAGGSCCGFGDAMIVDPADVVETEDPAKPYKILIRRTSSGLQLQEPYWIDVPADILIDQAQSAKICETYNDAAEAQNIDAFCSVPPFDVMFLRDYTSYNPNTGMHRVGQQYYPSGHVLIPEENTFGTPTRYCFQPAPQGF